MKAYSYIRWSSAVQTFGDSEKRQFDKAVSWCKSRDLVLSEQSFKDEGVSAKAGLNRAKDSAFAKLLSFVSAGDYILIEDYDRFSREDVLTSLQALRVILKEKQITIVFLSENVEVTQSNFMNDGIILPLFLKGFIGYRENSKKIERVKAAWNTKFENIKAGKVEAIKLPSWLVLADGKYKLVEPAASIVRRMFKLSNEGKGTGEIAVIFNREKLPMITRRKDVSAYNQSTVINCLRSKKVIGINDSVEPNVPNVYPRLVSDEVYYTTQAKLKERWTHRRGIKTTDTNIFSCICHCGECGKTLVRFMNQGPANSKKKYHYLKCSAVKAGVHKGAAIPYTILFNSFLNAIFEEKTAINAMQRQEQAPNNIDELKSALTVQNAKLESMAADYEAAPSKALASILGRLEGEIATLSRNLEAERTRVAAETPNEIDYDGAIERTIELLKTKDGTRAAREIIASIVGKIVVHKDRYEIIFKNINKPLVVHYERAGYWFMSATGDKKKFGYHRYAYDGSGESRMIASITHFMEIAAKKK